MRILFLAVGCVEAMPERYGCAAGLQSAHAPTDQVDVLICKEYIDRSRRISILSSIEVRQILKGVKSILQQEYILVLI